MLNESQCAGECLCKTKRQRINSLPLSIQSCSSSQLNNQFVRRHINSEITMIKSWEISSLREVSSEPTNALVLMTEVGVKSYSEWKPRSFCSSSSLAARATEAIHEESLLGDIQLERTFVLSPSELDNLCYKPAALLNNPLKSELFLRVLYMVSSMEAEDQDTVHSIYAQFLSEEQIRENVLKELRAGVSRLNQDLCHNESTNVKSECLTPLTNIKKGNSSVNLKSAELSHVSSAISLDSQWSDTSHEVDVSYHNPSKKKATGKLSDREKNLFAPLTF